MPFQSFLVQFTKLVTLLVCIGASSFSLIVLIQVFGNGAVEIIPLNQICHQIPSRSFHIDEGPMGICVRCLGIYLGVVLSMLIFTLASSHEKLIKYGLIVASFVTLTSIVMLYYGEEVPNHIRFIFGFCLGLVILKWSISLLFLYVSGLSFVYSKSFRKDL